MRIAGCALTLLVLAGAAIAQPDPAQAPPAESPEGDKPAATTTQPIPPAPQPVIGQPVLAAPATPIFAPPNDGPPPLTDEQQSTSPNGFRFGSYGRLVAGTDLRGGKPEAVNIVAHGPRIVEPSYLELDFSYGFTSKRGLQIRPVITLAFNATLFHDTGEFDAQPALRNMFVDAQVTSQLTAWAGSRMYRGDDIYLFDYWPLDDLNTVGGGLEYRKFESESGRGDSIELATHAGVNRLNTPFQFQQIDVANPEQGATTVTQLNRQRMLLSGTAAYLLAGPRGKHLKAKVHGEFHGLPSGTRKRDDGTFEALPADSGWLLGVELAAWADADDDGHQRHLNLFMRYAKGLAAFDELAPPTSFGPDLETNHASELTFGLAGAVDHELGNILFGALSRRFIDADASSTDPDDGWEYAIDARPLAKVLPDTFAGVDISYQARFPRGLNVNTLRAEDPSVFQIAPMLVYSPMGSSAYDRPQLRVVYRAAHLNEAALDQYVPDDPRHAHDWVHFLGFEAEWWFNSSTYGR